MERICPRCKTTSYQNPNMKLLVNICGHKLCEGCIDSVFTRPSAACPECGLALRRNQYRAQQFEDSYIEKEVEIRKKVLKDFNKTEEDFQSLREYNDYLEEVESIIFNLANGIEVEMTKEKIEQYKKENQNIITKNRQKLLRREQLLRAELDSEKTEQEMRNRQAQEEEMTAVRNKARQHETLLQELMTSERPASDVMAKVKTEKEDDMIPPVTAKPLFSKPQFKQQKGEVAFDSLPIDTTACYTYQPLAINTYGPIVPNMQQLEQLGYTKHIRQLDVQFTGGGYLPVHGCHKALQEAFSCLALQQQN